MKLTYAITAQYSHLNGLEFLMVHHKKLLKEITDTIKGIDPLLHKTKISKEKTMMGEAKYAPITLNIAFKEALQSKGWHESRTSYWVTSDHDLIRKRLPLRWR